MAVVLADLPSDDLDNAVHAMKGVSPRGSELILAAPTDVGDPAQMNQLHDRVIARFGKVNLLANNAATRIGRGHDADLGEWRSAMEVNFWGAVLGVAV
jgi:NAD(P)-dependent dehydrogenase (short-subunit alcohol dehydrogenase family)